MAHAPRSAKMRSSAPRPSVGSAPPGRLHVDTSALPGNMEYTWIRETYLGDNDRQNVADALRRRQYKPVMATDIPGYDDILLPGESTPEKYVRNGGLILCAREKVYADEERALEREETNNALQSVAKGGEALNARMDGKNFQKASDSGVQVRVDSSAANGKFADD